MAAAAAISSSKETFQQFRKAAMEKEEREKALKKKQLEGSKAENPERRCVRSCSRPTP